MSHPRSLASFVAFSVLVLTLAGVIGCAAPVTQSQGTSTEVAWRVEDVRVADVSHGSGRVWSYTLVLRETKGVDVTFRAIQTTSRIGRQDLGYREEPTAIHLEALGEQRVALSDGFSAGAGSSSSLASESLWVSKTLVGVTDHGRAAKVEARYFLDANAPGVKTSLATEEAADLVKSGMALLDEGRIAEAQPKFEAALDLSQDPDVQASALLGVATVLITRGQLSAAQSKAEGALQLARVPTVRDGASVLLGIVLLARGDGRAAEEHLLRASLSRDADVRAGALVGLAAIRGNKLFEKLRAQFVMPPIATVSVPSFPAGVEVWKNLLRTGMTALRSNLDANEVVAITALLRDALASARSRHVRTQASAFFGQWEFLVGRTDEAKRLLRSALTDAPSAVLTTQTRLGLGWIAFFDGNFGEAVREADQALAPLSRNRVHAAAAHALQLKAYALAFLALETPAGRQRDQTARGGHQALREALQILDETRLGIESDQERVLYFASSGPQSLLAEPMMAALLGALAEANPGGGLELAERGRARVLLDRITLRKAGGIELPPPLAENERTFRVRLLELQQALQLPTRHASVLQRELATARSGFNAFIDSLRRSADPRVRGYAALTYPKPMTVEQIQTVLRENEVLIEYKVGAVGTFVWVVRKHGPVRVRTVFIEGKRLREQVTALLTAVGRGPTTAFDPTQARALYDLLLKDNLADVPQGAPLVLVLDEALLILPFEILATGTQGETVSYLGERHPVRYYPSAATLVLSREGEVGRPDWAFPLLAVADPLSGESRTAPGEQGEVQDVNVAASYLKAATTRGYRFPPLRATRREVAEIVGILQAPSAPPHVMMGKEATKASLLDRDAGKELWRYRFVHLATHGILGVDLPGLNQPALLLSAGPGRDESSALLTMEEISRLRVTADLVVLSACQTGLGEEIAGEGVLALTRAVLQAGAASVVVSLWNVADDATATFMARFYSYLVKDGLDKARALQKAKLDFIRKAGGPAQQGHSNDHPFFWAPFILVGEDTSVGAGVSPEAPLATKSSEERVKADVDTLTSPAPPVFKGDDGAEMVLVPAGEFWMGSTEDEVARAVEDCKKLGSTESICRSQFGSELPRHRVALNTYYIDRYEVTNALFERFVDATKYRTTAELDGRGRSEQIRDRRGQLVMIDGASWRTPQGPGTTANPTHPVVQVSWDDGLAYCTWAGKRLPTEAEWEKAARGDDGRRYPWGDSWDRGKANAARSDHVTRPVGSYPAGTSPFGVHDMAGNVWEWVSDWFGVDYYKVSAERNPQGPETARWKALRGGSSMSAAVYSRTARRGNREPDFLSDYIGFRCARDASRVAAPASQPAATIVSATTAAVDQTNRAPSPDWSSWISGKEYQAAFDIKLREGFYPARVEGVQTSEEARFRAAFERLPLGAYFYSYFGLTEDRFAKRNAELASLGFRLIWTQTFVDTNGRVRYQATWIKN